jgi:hypothetical protein
VIYKMPPKKGFIAAPSPTLGGAFTPSEVAFEGGHLDDRINSMMRKPLSRPFKDERPRLEVGFIANKKAVFVTPKTYTFLCGKKDRMRG